MSSTPVSMVNALIKGTPQSQQSEDFWEPEWTLTRHQLCQCLGLDFPASGTVRKRLLFMPAHKCTLL